MTLLILGILLLYIAILIGGHLEISESTGTSLLDPFQVVVDQFTSTLVARLRYIDFRRLQRLYESYWRK